MGRAHLLLVSHCESIIAVRIFRKPLNFKSLATPEAQLPAPGMEAR
jgi:hypothetical protein